MSTKPQTAGAWLSLNSGYLLILISAFLLCIGLVAVASSSVAAIPGQTYLGYFVRQLIYACVGVTAALIVQRTQLKWYFDNAMLLWLFGTALLVVTVLPIFPAINGARRWIHLGVANFQTTELVKLIVLIYTADMVVRRAPEVRSDLRGLIRLVSALGVMLVFVAIQPDLGAMIVISVGALAIYFLAGSPMRQISMLSAVFVSIVVMQIAFVEFRRERMLSLLDVWGNEQGAGWQVSRGLMALGRGELFGAGLGESVFKLRHIPEVHTDSIIAVIGEETGFIGVSVVLVLFALWMFLIVYIAHQALLENRLREGYLVYGIACVFLMQIFVNTGMNFQLLPPKGLTLPLISFGGSSLMITLLMLGFVIKVHFESSRSPSMVTKYY